MKEAHVPQTEEGVVDQKILKWLTGTPASDVNFKSNLNRANEITIRTALEQIFGKPGQKTVETELRRRLKKILQEEVNNATDTNEQLNRTQALEMGTLLAEREEEQQRVAEQTEREKLIAQCHEVIGRVQANTLMNKFGTVANLVYLKEIKETKIYRDLPLIGTWENFCKYLHLDRRTVDEDLQNLAAFGEDFLETSRQFSLGYRDLRKLRQLTHDGAVTIDGDCLLIGEESIPINPDHADDLQAAIEKVIEEKNEISLKVEKLEKNVAEVVKEETKSLKAEVKALVKEVKRLKPFDPEEKDRSFCAEQMAEINDITLQCIATMSKFIIRDDVQSDPVIMGQVEGHIQSLELCLSDLRKRWEEKVNLYGE